MTTIQRIITVDTLARGMTSVSRVINHSVNILLYITVFTVGKGHPAVMRMLKHCLNKLQNLNTVVLITERKDILVLSVVNHTMFRVLFHNTFHFLNVHIIIFILRKHNLQQNHPHTEEGKETITLRKQKEL